MLHSESNLFNKDKYPEYGNHKMSFTRLQHRMSMNNNLKVLVVKMIYYNSSKIKKFIQLCCF